MRPYCAVLACAVSTTAFAGDLSVPHEHYQLDNGLDVILAPDHSTPIVHVQVWYDVGSKDEVQGRTGFAHLFEHLMFQGSANSPGEYFTPLQEVGASINGTTNTDRTNYFETLPSRYLPLALFMESDRMGNLLPVLDQTKLDNQREVVRNERRQRYENPPYGEAFKDLMENLYPVGHPYHHSTIGSHADLQAATLDDVKGFFGTWYVPNNASLVVSGDFDTKEAKKLIEANFGWIAKGEDPKHARHTRQPLAADVDVYQYDQVPHQKVWVAWQSPALFAPGDAELDVLSSLLCGGKDSRLYKAAVKERKIARDIGCYQVSRQLESAYIVSGTAAEGHSTDEIVALVDEILADVGKDSPPTAAEIEAAVSGSEVGLYSRMSTVAGKAGMLISYLNTTGKTEFVQQDLDRYLAVTPEKVVEYTTKVLDAPRVQLHIRPESDRPTQEARQ